MVWSNGNRYGVERERERERGDLMMPQIRRRVEERSPVRQRLQTLAQRRYIRRSPIRFQISPPSPQISTVGFYCRFHSSCCFCGMIRGDGYAGEWEHGHRHGYGIYCWPIGDCFEGYHCYSHRRGFGRKSFAVSHTASSAWSSSYMFPQVCISGRTGEYMSASGGKVPSGTLECTGGRTVAATRVTGR
jgi:hypothetical protein